MVVQESLRIEALVEHVDAVRAHFYLFFSEGDDVDFLVTGHMSFVPKRLPPKISKKCYVIGHVNRTSGVPVSNTVSYAGQTT